MQLRVLAPSFLPFIDLVYQLSTDHKQQMQISI